MAENKPVKVLLCSPHGKEVGGISRWTGHILNYYNNNNNTLIKLKHFYPDTKGAYADTPFLIRIYRGISSYIPFLNNLGKEIKKQEYDAIHFTSSASISLIRDILAIKLTNGKVKKTIVHFRFGKIPELYKKRNWEQKLLHHVIKLADKVVVIDMISYNTLIKQGYDNIELLPNPLAPQVTDIITENTHIEREDRKVVFAGHMVRTKGIFELIEACKDIKDIRLKMIGYVSDDIKAKLISVAGDGHENWLDIAGEQTFENTIKEMLSAGVFVLPTYTEGFPNVIIESMACGCSIVATNVGAIPEMLDIKNGSNYGICIEPKDVTALTSAIQKMLGDREYAIQCGKNAQQRVNDLYSMEKVWQQLEKLWSE